MSSAWQRSNHRALLTSLLDTHSTFRFREYGWGKSAEAADTPDGSLVRLLRPCHALLVPSAIPRSFVFDAQREIMVATSGYSRPKPIIAIRMPSPVAEGESVVTLADATVGWDVLEIVGAVVFLVR